VKALAHGVNQFAMIHDSYGTTAADSVEMAVCLRDSFADIYRDPPLEKFGREVQSQLGCHNSLLRKPEYGRWDPDEVRGSDFFFD
jgi:DNA-directed RNA polymerase